MMMSTNHSDFPSITVSKYYCFQVLLFPSITVSKYYCFQASPEVVDEVEVTGRLGMPRHLPRKIKPRWDDEGR
jgi:hypothetical protein